MTEITDQDIKALEALYEERLKRLKHTLARYLEEPDGYMWRLGPNIKIAQDELRDCQEAYKGWQMFKNMKDYHDIIKAEKEEVKE